MKCPECGKPSDVIDSRSRSDGGVRRRRRCFNGHKFSTLELPVPMTDQQAADMLVRIAGQMRDRVS